MARFMSPPPAISSFQEPEPSSDEDLVPNIPESPAQRKRKRTNQAASQPSKKRKELDATQNSIPYSSRPTNAVAGPSKARIPSSRRSKSPPSVRATAPSNGVAPRPSQASSSRQPKKAPAYSQPVPKERTSSASTKPVRRTRREKGRQRGSDSDSDPSTFKAQATNRVPSASAPVPRRRKSKEVFKRDALGRRFTDPAKSESVPIRRRNLSNNMEVIEVAGSSEEEPHVPVPVRVSDPEIIEVSDTDSESTIIRRKAAAKNAQKQKQKQNGIKPAPSLVEDLIEIFDSDEEPPAQVEKPAVTGKAKDASPAANGSTLKVEDASPSRQMSNGSSRSRSPSADPMTLEPNEGLDFGGNDIAMRETSPWFGIPEADLNSAHPPLPPFSPVNDEAPERPSPAPEGLAAARPLAEPEPEPERGLEPNGRDTHGPEVPPEDRPLNSPRSPADKPESRTDPFSPSLQGEACVPHLNGAAGPHAHAREPSPKSPQTASPSGASSTPPPLQDQDSSPDLNGAAPAAKIVSSISTQPTNSSPGKRAARPPPPSPPPSPPPLPRPNGQPAEASKCYSLNKFFGVQKSTLGRTTSLDDASLSFSSSPGERPAPMTVELTDPVATPLPQATIPATTALRALDDSDDENLPDVGDILSRMGLLESAPQAKDTVAAPASKPPSQRRLPHPSLPVASSPYKGMRERALGTSVATLQLNLGLPVTEPAWAHPRLDLRTLRTPPSKKRHSLPQTATPPARTLDAPDRQEQREGGLEGFAFPTLPSPKKPQSPVPKPPLPWKKQSSLVEEMITTGQHTAQSQPASPLPLPRFPLPRRLPSLRRPPSPQPPRTPPVLQTPLTPPLKLEEAESRAGPSSTSLIDNIIDLTLSSDDEADAPPVQVSRNALDAPPAQAPRNALNGLAEVKRYSDRMSKLIKGRTSSVNSNALSGNSKSSGLDNPSVESPHGGADGPGSAGHFGPIPDQAPQMNGTSRRTTPGHSPLPPLSPPRINMEIDTEGGIPPQAEQQLPPETLNVVSVPLTVVLAGAPEERPGDVAERELTAPALQQNQDDRVPSWWGRSYDDTGFYQLEYIGPPTTYNYDVSELDEVEDLVAPGSASDGVPTPQDMGNESEEAKDLELERITVSSTDEYPAPRAMSTESHPSDDDTAPGSAKHVLVISDDDDDKSSASPKPALRRSSRRSSHSSTDPLDLFLEENDDYEESFGVNTPMSLMFPRVAMPAVSRPSDDSASEILYPVMTWDSYRRDLSNFQLPVYYAKDLVSLLHDYINASDEYFRGSLNMRRVFESAIRENTGEDEPDAPWIDVINDVDDEATPPWEFYYTNKIWLGEGISPPDVTKLVGCDCRGKCDPKSTTCACVLRQNPYVEKVFGPGFAYDSKGRLRTPKAPIFECNAMCSCDDDECKNRVVQHGRKCSVSIKKTPDKGWGVFASKKILKGTFIGVYSGEFLKDDVSERRGLVYDKSGRTYLLDITYYYLAETQYVVDAYHVGNFTRFLNNSCDPNCRVNPCYINEPDLEKPLLTLWARRDIAIGEELCFSYQGHDPDDADQNEDNEAAHTIVNICRCGAATCTGFMFS